MPGGIPQRDVENLNAYWNAFPNLKAKLFKDNSRSGYYDLKISTDEIRTAIFESHEFSEFTERIQDIFRKWCEQFKPVLKGLDVGTSPKNVGKDLSESILEYFSGTDLIENYDVYQDFMTYWAETMQDDLYLVSTGGWKINLELIKDKRGKITDWDCPLLPKEVLSEIYFKELKEKIEGLESELESISSQKQNMEEENSGDEDLFSDVRNEKDKISKNKIPQRIVEIENDPENREEFEVLRQYLKLLEKETSTRSEIKSLESLLDKRLREKFNVLNEKEIKESVIGNKWFHSLETLLNGKVEQAFYNLSDRLRVLDERYAIPLPELTSNSINLTETVEGYLRELGFEW